MENNNRWKAPERIAFAFILFFLTTDFLFVIRSTFKIQGFKQSLYELTGVRAVKVLPWAEDVIPFFINLAVLYILYRMMTQPSLVKRMVASLLENIWLPSLLLLTIASAVWSIFPSATLAGIYLVLKITLIGLYLPQRFTASEILEMLVGASLIGGVLSLLASLLIPKASGTDFRGEYFWRGIYEAKNQLGRYMALGSGLALVYGITNSKSLFKAGLALITFGLSLFLLIQSSSVSSMAIAFGMYGLVIYYLIWVQWVSGMVKSIRTAYLIAPFAALTLIAFNYAAILGLINRDPNLTGRLGAWQILWEWIQKKPLLGYGYEAFWLQFSNATLDIGWPLAHAHNGYIEIALALGLAGIVLFSGMLLKVWKDVSFNTFNTHSVFENAWIVTALFYFTFLNFTYSIGLGFANFHWTLIVTLTALSGKLLPQKIKTQTETRPQ